MKSTDSPKPAAPIKKAATKQGRPHKDYADVQRSIQSGSPEALAKKILNTPPRKGRSNSVKKITI